MGARRLIRRLGPRLLLHAVLLVFAFAYIMPFIWMISTSLKGSTEYLRPGLNLIPKEVRWDNYTEVIERIPFATFYWNTVVVTVMRVVAQVALATTAGYAFARFRFKGRAFLFVAVLVILMVPPPVTLVPNFVIVRHLGWVNTYTGLVVPTIWSAFGVFLFRQFFLTLPRDLIDAAKLDGCRPWRVFWHIGLPAARAHIAAFALLVALYSWNEFLWSLVVATDNDRRVVSVGIYLFSSGYIQEWGLMMAAATMSIVPLLIVFAIAQKHLIRGITLTGLKG
jgi:multiple sugar transport system permease protein